MSFDFRNYDLEGVTILVVEDDDQNIILYQEIFSRTKAKIYLAKNGKIAIDICNRVANLNLVIMDIIMPIIDDYEAANTIKKSRPNLPVFVITVINNKYSENEFLDMGFDKYISKPFRIKTLLNLVESYINMSSKTKAIVL